MIAFVRRRTAFLIDPQGRSIPIEERLVVGRSRENDMVIPSGRVARRHLALVRMPSGEVEAEDLLSTNGTRHRAMGDVELTAQAFIAFERKLSNLALTRA